MGQAHQHSLPNRNMVAMYTVAVKTSGYENKDRNRWTRSSEASISIRPPDQIATEPPILI